MLNKMPTDEINFTKEIDNFDESSGERGRQSEITIHTVPLRSVKESTSTMGGDYSFEVSDTDEDN